MKRKKLKVKTLQKIFCYKSTVLRFFYENDLLLLSKFVMLATISKNSFLLSQHKNQLLSGETRNNEGSLQPEYVLLKKKKRTQKYKMFKCIQL